MKAIDLQTQMTTEKGALFKFPGAKERFEAFFKTKIPYYQSEEEMINVFRGVDVKVMLVPPTADKRGIGEIRELNNYVGELKRLYPDTVLGGWVILNPDIGIVKGLRELERCIKDLGAVGLWVSALRHGIPANDKTFYPLYDLCQEAGVPVRITVGFTALGAGQPGGGGVKLKTENPIPNIDDVAADFPQLTIIGAHCPWPFHNEMIAVMLHKANVYCELHGWSPKYFPPEIKGEIRTRLRHKFMFGSDYPFFSYERLFQDWEGEGYSPEVLENIYYKNAQKVFNLPL